MLKRKKMGKGAITRVQSIPQASRDWWLDATPKYPPTLNPSKGTWTVAETQPTFWEANKNTLAFYSESEHDSKLKQNPVTGG